MMIAADMMPRMLHIIMIMLPSMPMPAASPHFFDFSLPIFYLLDDIIVADISIIF